MLIKKEEIALAGWLTWVEYHSVHQKAAHSIPGQGTYSGGEFDPQLGPVQEATD